MFVLSILFSLLVIATITSPISSSSISTLPPTELPPITPSPLSSSSLSSSASISTPCHRHFSAPQLTFPTCTSVNGPTGLRNVVFNSMGCTCDFNTYDINRRDDYQYVEGIGIYKFHTRGATFNTARKICNEEGAHLAVIETAAEERVLLNLFEQFAGNLRNVTNNEQAFIGIHDLFFEGDWVTILGDSIHKNGYTKWSDRWGIQPDNGGGVQHCGTLLKQGGMDDVSCNAQFSFFCEIPRIRIGH